MVQQHSERLCSLQQNAALVIERTIIKFESQSHNYEPITRKVTLLNEPYERNVLALPVYTGEINIS